MYNSGLATVYRLTKQLGFGINSFNSNVQMNTLVTINTLSFMHHLFFEYMLVGFDFEIPPLSLLNKNRGLIDMRRWPRSHPYLYMHKCSDVKFIAMCNRVFNKIIII